MSLFLKDEEFLPAAISLIAGAEKSIYISTFKIEVTSRRRGIRLIDFFDTLRKKHQSGVDVRILTNKRDNRGHVPISNTCALCHFKKIKIPVRYLPNDRVTHAKILIVDRYKAIIGSHNLSVKSCHNNFELSISVNEVVPISFLACVYEELWNKAKKA